MGGTRQPHAEKGSMKTRVAKIPQAQKQFAGSTSCYQVNELCCKYTVKLQATYIASSTHARIVQARGSVTAVIAAGSDNGDAIVTVGDRAVLEELVVAAIEIDTVRVG